MIRGFYTARTGLVAHQEHMNTISNNMANVNTTGFKPMRTAFTDLVYQNLNRDQVENPVMVGHGVRINKNDLMMAQGPLQSTQRAMDFALTDENAFFAVNTALGETLYTRAGNFALSNDDDTFYLVNAVGDRVLDSEGEEIEIEFDDQGNIDFDPSVLGVYRFSNPYGLSLAGENRFTATEISGIPEVIEQPNMKVGYLEGSSVEIGNEMAKVIEASKAFSFSSRMIMVADEVEQMVNNLR